MKSVWVGFDMSSIPAGADHFWDVKNEIRNPGGHTHGEIDRINLRRDAAFSKAKQRQRVKIQSALEEHYRAGWQLVSCQPQNLQLMEYYQGDYLLIFERPRTLNVGAENGEITNGGSQLEMESDDE